jgi:hypothetical protein
MAVIPWVYTTEGGAGIYTWGPIATGDTCQPLAIPGHSDKTITIEGTVTTFALQGSNDPTGANPRTLHDIDMTTPITAAGIYTIKENPLVIIPLLTTGSGVTVAIVTW